MTTIGLRILNALQWTAFALWSFFWMSAAIVYGLIVRHDPHTPLSWARRYWGAGLVHLARATLVKHPGFEPEAGKPYFFAMNHQSLFDIVAAFVCIPENLRFVAKKSLRLIPFLGWYMTVTRMVFIDRQNREEAKRSLEEACEKIKTGISILTFPEGTRSRDGSILPLKKGLFIMAIQAGVPIVPVAIEGAQNLLQRDTLRIQPCRIDLVIGQPIPTAGLTLDDRDALMVRVRDAMIQLHRSIGGRGGEPLGDLIAAGSASSQPDLELGQADKQGPASTASALDV